MKPIRTTAFISSPGWLLPCRVELVTYLTEWSPFAEVRGWSFNDFYFYFFIVFFILDRLILQDVHTSGGTNERHRLLQGREGRRTASPNDGVGHQLVIAGPLFWFTPWTGKESGQASDRPWTKTNGLFGFSRLSFARWPSPTTAEEGEVPVGLFTAATNAFFTRCVLFVCLFHCLTSS